MSFASAPSRVAEIMTKKLITLSEDDRLHNVEESMEKYRFRHLPVVRGTKLVGLITQRDMLRIASTPFSTQQKVRDHLIHYLPAREIMRTEVATVSPHTNVVEAGQLMWDMKVGCLCVTDDDDNLVGIITEADYLKLALRLVKQLSGPPGPPPKK